MLNLVVCENLGGNFKHIFSYLNKTIVKMEPNEGSCHSALPRNGCPDSCPDCTKCVWTCVVVKRRG